MVRYSSRFSVPAQALFQFHMSVANLERISPPVPRVRIESQSATTTVGDLQVITLSLGPFRTSWDARILGITPGTSIVDEQESGPFRRWRHRHAVSPDGNGSRLTDTVAFRLFPGPLGEVLDYFMVAPALWTMFAWRHRRTRQLLSETPGTTRS